MPSILFTIFIASLVWKESTSNTMTTVGQFCFLPSQAISCTKNRIVTELGTYSVVQTGSKRLKLREVIGQNLFRRFTFQWVGDIIKLGSNKKLDLKDIWEFDEVDRMTPSSTKFVKSLEDENYKALKEVKTKSTVNNLTALWNSPTVKAVIKMYKQHILTSAGLKLLHTFLSFLPSILLTRLLGTLESGLLRGTASLRSGYLLAISLFLSICVRSMVENQCLYECTNTGISLRGVLSSTIFRKALRLSPDSRQNITSGEVSNIMQLDTVRLENVLLYLHTSWDGILQIVGYTALLFKQLGSVSLAGVALLALAMGTNNIFLTKLSALRSQMLDRTDARIRLTSEVLQGIQAVKSYSWEEPFLKELTGLRERELQACEQSADALAVVDSVLAAAPAMVAALTLGLYSALGHALSPVKVFTSLALFDQLQSPLLYYPLVLQTLAEGRISLERLDRFLGAEEVQDYVDRGTNPKVHPPLGKYNDAPESAINITEGDFCWGGRSSRLLVPNLTVRRGELVAVIGPLGSGKSTLLAAMLGELVRTGGQVSVFGDVSYVPQSPWIPNDSLRNVILFGSPYDEVRYKNVLRVCGLEKDLLQLEAGDLTEIGERGTNLSGGQKQRVSIARAVYNDVDVYLMDDPLSALDPKVRSELFKECIQTMLAGRTRILVTHELSVLPLVDRIVLMGRDKDGNLCVADQGTYSEMRSRNLDLEQIAAVDDSESITKSAGPSIAEDEGKDSLLDGFPRNEFRHENEYPSLSPDKSTYYVGNHDFAGLTHDVHAVTVAPIKRLISSEESAVGGIGWPVLRSYFKSARKPLLIGIAALALVMSSASVVMQQLLIAAWSEDFDYRRHKLRMYLGATALVAAVLGCFDFLRVKFALKVGRFASSQLHLDLLSRVLRAPLSYFESTPVGRITQQFSKDLDEIDTQLPVDLEQALASFALIACHLALICSITPSFIVLIAPTALAYYTITNYYRKTALQLKRLDSISRSPIYSHTTEMLGGASVIRTFNKQAAYISANERKLDVNLASYFSLETSDRWLCLRLDAIGGLVVLAAAVLALASNSQAGAVGISLTNAFHMTGMMHWAVRNAVDSEAVLSSVERVLKVVEETPQEESTLRKFESALSPPSNISAIDWPRRGDISMLDVTMHYQENAKAVLKGVSINFMPGESVGIVGRTGSGKSSLFRALLRLTELHSGKVMMDGWDIAGVPLDILRSKVSIIPQEPVLFSGSIRSNLDPHNQFNDETLHVALTKVNLRDRITALGGLSAVVSESGDNFSQGEKQLLCLARALVRRPKILLMDEATSSMDSTTDQRIQRTIRSEFRGRGCTVLTIAHRLRTVLDMDRVLVMDSGRVAELGRPMDLLSDTNSYFFKLVAAEGSASEAVIGTGADTEIVSTLTTFGDVCEGVQT